MTLDSLREKYVGRACVVDLQSSMRAQAPFCPGVRVLQARAAYGHLLILISPLVGDTETSSWVSADAIKGPPVAPRDLVVDAIEVSPWSNEDS